MRLTQRAFLFHKTQFEFGDKLLSYRIEDERTVFGFSILYENIPSERSSQAFREKWLHYIGLLVLYADLLVWLGIWAKPASGKAILLGLALAVVSLACILISRWALFDGTVIATKLGKIIVFDRANKDEVIDEIYRRRNAEIRRKYAIVDFLADPRAEIAKFRSLKDRGIISEQEFDDATSKITAASEDDPNVS